MTEQTNLAHSEALLTHAGKPGTLICGPRPKNGRPNSTPNWLGNARLQRASSARRDRVSERAKTGGRARPGTPTCTQARRPASSQMGSNLAEWPQTASDRVSALLRRRCSQERFRVHVNVDGGFDDEEPCPKQQSSPPAQTVARRDPRPCRAEGNGGKVQRRM